MWGYSYPHDETTTFNVDFPAPASRKVTTKPTRFVHPHSWFQPTKTPTFPHQHAEKSPLQQHVVSYTPIDSILADKNGPGHLCIADARGLTGDLSLEGYNTLPIVSK